jgi:hypothetical protein
LFLRYLLRAMCSHYNGIQVFLFPGTIFYWLSSANLVLSFSSLVNSRIHYLPLVFFMVLFAYVCFMVLKIYSCLFEGPHSLYPHKLEEFFDHIISLHLTLFVTVIVLMIFYVLSRFMAYFYGIQLPLNKGVWFTFRGFTVLLILLYYLRSMWLYPLHNTGYSVRRRERYCLAWILRHPFAALKYTMVMIVLLISAVRLYQLIIVVALSPALSYFAAFSGIELSIVLQPVTGIGSVFLNVFLLFAAFMLSNLMFYPFIYLGQMLVKAMHPIQFKQVKYAEG